MGYKKNGLCRTSAQPILFIYTAYLYRPSLHGRDKFLLGFYKGVHPGDFISPDSVVGGLEDKRDIIGARVVHD